MAERPTSFRHTAVDGVGRHCKRFADRYNSRQQ